MARGLSTRDYLLISWIITTGLRLVNSTSEPSPEHVTSQMEVAPSWLLKFEVSYTTPSSSGIHTKCGRYYAGELLNALVYEAESGMQAWCDHQSNDSEHYVQLRFTDSAHVHIRHNVIKIYPVLNISQWGLASGKEQILDCGRSLNNTLVSTSSGFRQLWDNSLAPIPEDTQLGCVSSSVTSHPLSFITSDWQCPQNMPINLTRWGCGGSDSDRKKQGDQMVEIIGEFVRSSTAIEVWWQVRTSGEYIDGYYLKYRIIRDPVEDLANRERDANSEYKIETIQSGLTRYSLHNLSKFTNYQLLIQPYNSTHIGNESNIVRVQTGEDVPSSPPQNISAYFLDDTTLHVDWLPPPRRHLNGHLQGYKLFLSLTDSNSNFSREIKTDGSKHALTVRHLVRGKPYQLQMSAFTKVGEGKRSDLIPLIDVSSSGNHGDQSNCGLLIFDLVIASILFLRH